MIKTDWTRLDNAALIYTSLLSDTYATNFRMSVTLDEDVDPSILNEALQKTIDRFPSFRFTIKKGLYWWYMKTVTKAPKLEKAGALTPLPLGERGGFLFKLGYNGKVVTLDVFHSLCDGTGALTFLLSTTGEYMRLRYGKEITYNNWVLDPNEAPKESEIADGFDSFTSNAGSLEKNVSAYHVKGHEIGHGILENTRMTISADALKEASHRHDCTVTDYLTAMMIKALMRVRNDDNSRRKSPHVKISVPVNLRNIFSQNTFRNFSSYVNVGVDASDGNLSLDEIIKAVAEQKQDQIIPEKLEWKVNGNVRLENNAFIRAVPCVIKKPIIAFFGHIKGDKFNTQTMSNIGVVKLPEEMVPHVEAIDFQLGRQFTNVGAASCVTVNGLSRLNFSRTIRETKFEQEFVRVLESEGLSVLVEPELECSKHTVALPKPSKWQLFKTALKQFAIAIPLAITGIILLPVSIVFSLRRKWVAATGPFFML